MKNSNSRGEKVMFGTVIGGLQPIFRFLVFLVLLVSIEGCG